MGQSPITISNGQTSFLLKVALTLSTIASAIYIYRALKGK